MRRILLTIAYDGREFVGWQVQPNGVSVQEILEREICRFSGEDVRLYSSGRTDAGVHAAGMMAHFDTTTSLPVRAYREAVNGRLPGSIAIRDAVEAPSEFHARFSAVGKWYRYTLYCNEVRSPFAEGLSWHIRRKLNLTAMEEGLAFFAGEHDFRGFRASSCVAKGTVREIFAVRLVDGGEQVHIDICGSGFLQHMVRIMVGTLVEVGLEKRSAEEIAELLKTGERGAAGLTAPPDGLMLREVWYDREVLMQEVALWGRKSP